MDTSPSSAGTWHITNALIVPWIHRREGLEGETYEAKAAEKEAKRNDRLKDKRNQRGGQATGASTKSKEAEEEEAGFSVFGIVLW